MARSRLKAHTRIAPDSFIADLRSLLPRVVARIATAIQQEVEVYDGPVLGDRRKLIEEALGAGLREFFDRVAGKARPSSEVDRLFRTLGHGEATDGQSLEAMRWANDVATREVWDELHRAALRHNLPVSVLGRLGDALFDHVNQLLGEVELGYRGGLDEQGADTELAREQLVWQLLNDTDTGRLDELAAAAQWLLPELVICICMRPLEGLAPPNPELVTPEALVVADSRHVLWLCDARRRDTTVGMARRAAGSGLLVVSIPMPPAQVSTAARFAKRAHQLAEQGVITATGTIDCADYEETLWLHAEPVLRERLAERLLAPLAAETPHRRRMLALTLLIWLEQRASAPAIARTLGVHPQTVRHRLRQLDVMFDERLRDPDVAFPMLLALKATLPSWLAAAPANDDA